MASGIGKISAKHFQCAICLERLKEPKLLTCQHTYCRECLEQLVTAENWHRLAYEVTCPECRKKTRIPADGVRGLQSNFFVNNLLSELDGQYTASIPSCEKHGGEIFKHFCQTCDQLICQHCIVIDHRDHMHELLKDIYPAEKEKVEKIVEKSRAKILALENSLETLNLTESRIQSNGTNAASKIDTFIDQQIEILQEKRQRLKDELQELSVAQKEQHEAHQKLFSFYLGRMKQSVEFAEQALSTGNEVEVLAAKNQLNQLNSATAELQPHNMVSYDLEIDSPLDKKMVSKTAKIRECDEEYDIEMQNNWSSGRHFVSYFYEEKRQFEIRRKTNETLFDFLPVDKMQVKIKRQGSNHVDLPPIDKLNEDGSFTFGYCPPQDGDYQIEVFVNGRLNGSPFEWEVV